MKGLYYYLKSMNVKRLQHLAIEQHVFRIATISKRKCSNLCEFPKENLNQKTFAQVN